jgi:hypothetical protein
MPSKAALGFIDRSGESSRTSYYVATVADAAAASTAADNIQIGIAVITLCNLRDLTLQVVVSEEVPTLPLSAFAQREVGLEIFYADAVTGEKARFTIPGPDLVLVGQAGTDTVDIVSNVTMAAFVIVFEANAKSKDGNAVEVTGARIIGRNN